MFALPTEGWPMNSESAGTTLADLQQQLAGYQSGYNCSLADPLHRQDYITCNYQYLALYNGSVYFVHPNASVQAPPVNIDWMLGATLGIDYVPSLHNITATHNLTASTPVITYEQAIFTFFTFGHNFYHVFAEYMPTVHVILCRYLGLCSYNPNSQVQMIMVDPFDVHEHNWYQPISPALTKCISSLPVRHLRSPQWEGKLVVLKNVLGGWGREARVDHGHMHHWEDRHPPARNMLQLWRQRLASCLRFDADKQASTNPVQVVIVDRAYGGGRTFLNVQQMVDLITRKYPQGVNVTLKYLEGASMEEAAHTFDDATVVIWQHGAAMANLIFLPHGATGIQVRNNFMCMQVVMRDRPPELLGWPDELVRDLPNNVQLVHMLTTNPDRMVLRPGIIRWSQEWGPGGLSTKDKLAVWEQKTCPGREYDHSNHNCEEFWFKIGASLEVDLAQLEEALDLVVPQYLPGRIKRSRQ